MCQFDDVDEAYVPFPTLVLELGGAEPAERGAF